MTVTFLDFCCSAVFHFSLYLERLPRLYKTYVHAEFNAWLCWHSPDVRGKWTEKCSRASEVLNTSNDSV